MYNAQTPGTCKCGTFCTQTPIPKTPSLEKKQKSIPYPYHIPFIIAILFTRLLSAHTDLLTLACMFGGLQSIRSKASLLHGPIS